MKPKKIDMGRYAVFLYFVIFSVFGYIKSPDIFLRPRMWAEEAVSYFVNFSNSDFFSNIFFVHIGSFQLLTNFAVYLATIVKTEKSAHVTTSISFAVHIFIVLQIYLFCKSWNISNKIGLVIVLCAIMITPSYEVWMTATNIQWLAGLSMVFALGLSREALDRHRFGLLAWALICGLSGVPACIAAPLFLVRGIRGERAALLIGAALAICALVQAGVIVAYGTPGRVWNINPMVLTLAPMLHSVISPLFGADFSGHIAAAIVRKDAFSTGVMGTTAIVSIAFFALVVRLAYHERSRDIVLALAGLWLLAGVIQTFGALGDGDAILFAWNGSRYFLTSIGCLLVLLAIGTASNEKISRQISTGLLVLISVTGIAQWANSPIVPRFTTGPSWAKQVKACKPDMAECRIVAWPADGEAFVVRMPAHAVKR